jgi:hypothetical protein
MKPIVDPVVEEVSKHATDLGVIKAKVDLLEEKQRKGPTRTSRRARTATRPRHR